MSKHPYLSLYESPNIIVVGKKEQPKKIPKLNVESQHIKTVNLPTNHITPCPEVLTPQTVPHSYVNNAPSVPVSFQEPVIVLSYLHCQQNFRMQEPVPNSFQGTVLPEQNYTIPLSAAAPAGFQQNFQPDQAYTVPLGGYVDNVSYPVNYHSYPANYHTGPEQNSVQSYNYPPSLINQNYGNCAFGDCGRSMPNICENSSLSVKNNCKFSTSSVFNASTSKYSGSGYSTDCAYENNTANVGVISKLPNMLTLASKLKENCAVQTSGTSNCGPSENYAPSTHEYSSCKAKTSTLDGVDCTSKVKKTCTVSGKETSTSKPTADEICTPDATKKINYFSNEDAAKDAQELYKIMKQAPKQDLKVEDVKKVKPETSQNSKKTSWATNYLKNIGYMPIKIDFLSKQKEESLKEDILKESTEKNVNSTDIPTYKELVIDNHNTKKEDMGTKLKENLKSENHNIETGHKNGEKTELFDTKININEVVGKTLNLNEQLQSINRIKSEHNDAKHTVCYKSNPINIDSMKNASSKTQSDSRKLYDRRPPSPIIYSSLKKSVDREYERCIKYTSSLKKERLYCSTENALGKIKSVSYECKSRLPSSKISSSKKRSIDRELNERCNKYRCSHSRERISYSDKQQKPENSRFRSKLHLSETDVRNEHDKYANKPKSETATNNFMKKRSEEPQRIFRTVSPENRRYDERHTESKHHYRKRNLSTEYHSQKFHNAIELHRDCNFSPNNNRNVKKYVSNTNYYTHSRVLNYQETEKNEGKHKFKSGINKLAKSRLSSPSCSANHDMTKEKDKSNVFDLRSILSRKNVLHYLDSVKKYREENDSKQHDKLVITIQNENHEDQEVSNSIEINTTENINTHNDSKTLEKPTAVRNGAEIIAKQGIKVDAEIEQQKDQKGNLKKTKKFKVVINVICESSDSEDSEEDTNIGTISNEDLSFLDDLNIDEIVESLASKSENNICTNSDIIQFIDLSNLVSDDDDSDASTVLLEELSEINDNLITKNEQTNTTHSTNISKSERSTEQKICPTLNEIIIKTEPPEIGLPDCDHKLLKHEPISEKNNFFLPDLVTSNETCEVIENGALSLHAIKKEVMDDREDDKGMGKSIDNMLLKSCSETAETTKASEVKENQYHKINEISKISEAKKSLAIDSSKNEVKDLKVKMEPYNDYKTVENFVSEKILTLDSMLNVQSNIVNSVSSSSGALKTCTQVGNILEKENQNSVTKLRLDESIANTEPFLSNKNEENTMQNQILFDKLNTSIQPVNIDTTLEGVMDKESVNMNATTSKTEELNAYVANASFAKQNLLSFAKDNCKPAKETAINVCTDQKNDTEHKQAITCVVPNDSNCKDENQEKPFIDLKSSSIHEEAQVLNTNKSKKEKDKELNHNQLSLKENYTGVSTLMNELVKETTTEANNIKRISSPADIINKDPDKQSNEEINATDKNKKDELGIAKSRNHSPIPVEVPDLSMEKEKYLACLLENNLLHKLGEPFAVTSLIKIGQFSKIFKCENSHKKAYALKLSSSWVQRRRSFEITNMILFMQSDIPVENLHFIKIFTNFTVGSRYCCMMEYYPLTLDIAIKKATFHINEIKLLFRQLIAAITVLRENNVVHSDIKPSHILLNHSKDSLKLCGFDEAHYYEDGMVRENHIGTVNYRAPELILGYSAGYSIDVWAAGLVLYEMATGRMLFPGNRDNEILFKQICALGTIPLEMIQQSTYRANHYHGPYFLKHIPPYVRWIHFSEFYKNSMITRTLQNVYRNYWTKNKNDTKVEVDFYNYCELLQQMLEIHPNNRIPIEFVYAHRFCYKFTD